ncbi:MAG: nucleoside deaminase [Bdellovibrionales bacterium]|nr:nucleoside deaminase [Bdellovibrionales bacterium]
MNNLNADTEHMRQVLEMSQNCKSQDVPISGLLTYKGEVVCKASNQREKAQSPLGHVEIELIQKAASHTAQWRLQDTCLYVLIEPCIMCTGAIFQARIPRVVFGAKNPKGGALCFVQAHRKTLNINHSVEIISGFFETEIQDLLSNFFSHKRKNSK